VVEDKLGAATIPRGTQVLILNNFNHRDRETLPDADAYKPERWLDGERDYRFNHFSNGPQGCIGQELALFIAKAVLASMLRSGHTTLLKPSLRLGGPLPHAFNHFGAVFSRTDEM
jgi:cytochrome P450